MDKPPQKPKYLTAEEFLAGAKESPALAKMFQELEDEAKKDLLDEVQLRRQEDWGELAHLIVGAEGRT